MKKIVLFFTLFFCHHSLIACEKKIEQACSIDELTAMYTELFDKQKKQGSDFECTRLLLKIQSCAEFLILIKSNTSLALSDWARAIDELARRIPLASELSILDELHKQEQQLYSRLIPASESMEEMEQHFYNASIELRRQNFAQAYIAQKSALAQESAPAIKRPRSTTPETPQRTPFSQAQLAALYHKKP
jgi:hypothetical protein